MRQERQGQTESKQCGWTLLDLLASITLFLPAVFVFEQVKVVGGGVLRYVFGLPLALLLGASIVFLQWYSGRFLWQRSQAYSDSAQNIVAFGLFALQLGWILLACICGSGLAQLVIKFAV